MTATQRIAQMVVLMAAMIAAFFIVAQNVGAQEFRPEAWEMPIEYVVAWNEYHVGEDDETFSVIGVAFSSPECPDGAAMLEFVVSPEIYPRNNGRLVDICDGGALMVDWEMSNVLALTLNLRLQYGVYVSEASYYIDGMTHDEFWNEVNDAHNAVVKHHVQYVPMVGR